MKINLIVLLSTLFIHTGYAQGNTVTVNEKYNQGKIVEITSNNVVHNTYDSSGSVHFSITKSETSMPYLPNHLPLSQIDQQDAHFLKSKLIGRNSYLSSGSETKLTFQNGSYFKESDDMKRSRESRKVLVGLGLLGGSAFFMYMVSSVLTP
jgi:hypothetical protein